MVEILRCPGCGFRIQGFPAQYLNRRMVVCPHCRLETPLSIEDRLRLKRLILEERGAAIRPGAGRAFA
jgi:hypothetical protein